MFIEMKCWSGPWGPRADGPGRNLVTAGADGNGAGPRYNCADIATMSGSVSMGSRNFLENLGSRRRVLAVMLTQKRSATALVRNGISGHGATCLVRRGRPICQLVWRCVFGSAAWSWRLSEQVDYAAKWK